MVLPIVKYGEKVLREKLSTDAAQMALIDRMVDELTASKPN